MKSTIGLAALALLFAGAVRAHPVPGPEVTAGAKTPPTNFGVALELGGGVTSYGGTEMQNATNMGYQYEARAILGTRLYVAGEVAYVGARRAITSTFPGVSDGHIFSHAVEAAVRFQYPMYSSGWLIEPFAFGGIGWAHYGLDAPVNTQTAMATSDDVVNLPFGGGISAGWNQLFIEGRFTYRPVFNEDLLKDANGNAVSLNNWSAGAFVGYEF